MSGNQSALALPLPLPLPQGAETPATSLSAADWSRVGRLLLLSALAVLGSVGNVFMISAVMIEDHLKKRGNAFLVNVALADLLVTGLVIPASVVAILAGVPSSPAISSLQWFLALLCCLVTGLTQAATAAENYARLCSSPECYMLLTPGRITAALLAIWFASATVVALQFALEAGHDYCARRSPLLPYHAVVGALFVLLPALLTFACYARVAARVRTARSRASFKPPAAFGWDCALTRTNLYSAVLFVAFWLPFGVLLAVQHVQQVPTQLCYNLAWLALSRSCFNNLLYCVVNRHFRNAYVNLFHYCCCKTTVSFSRRTRGGDAARPSGDVRVHIIPGYNMYSYTSPQRAREVGRPSTSRPNGRDVYEL